MKEHGKEILTAISLAAVVVFALFLASNLFTPYLKLPSISPTPFAFAWSEGNNDTANSTVALVISTLSPEFTFINASGRIDEQAFLRTFGIPTGLPLSGQGDFNITSTSMTSFGFQPQTIVCKAEDLALNGSFSMTVTLDTTIYTTLEATQNVDLGTYVCSNESYTVSQNGNQSESSSVGQPTWNNSGYWQPTSAGGMEIQDLSGANWGMETKDLSGMLQGSGNASITFHAVIHAEVDYETTINGVNTTGVNTASWEGNLEVVQVTYDQSTIVWMEQQLQAIQLTALTVPE